MVSGAVPEVGVEIAEVVSAVVSGWVAVGVLSETAVLVTEAVVVPSSNVEDPAEVIVSSVVMGGITVEGDGLLVSCDVL